MPTFCPPPTIGTVTESRDAQPPVTHLLIDIESFDPADFL